jgi:murein DD-endopeptidase MepM/ murein hydrolase activator NlpD
MGYALPTTTDWVTASWQDHKNRNPPSSEPGTDYGSAYDSPLYAVADGTVRYVKTSNSEATGRVIEYQLDDGRTTRSLHLAEVWVQVGQRVSKGQQIGRTGASGFGSNWGYGAHLHQTLWPGGAWQAPTIDFALYVGEDPPPPPPPPPAPRIGEDMGTLYYQTADDLPNGPILTFAYAGSGEGTAAWLEIADVTLANRIAANTLSGQAIHLSRGTYTAWHSAYLSDTPPSSDPQQQEPLVRPAWTIGFILGVIGFIEVVKFILDVVVT